MMGAASMRVPLPTETLEACIREGFAVKGDRVAEANIRAFRLGRESLAPAQG
jgi:Pyruvate/2-oxoacid:ferredoxin oxidoreductase gamma subunit